VRDHGPEFLDDFHDPTLSRQGEMNLRTPARPESIRPQGHLSGLDADMLDGIHAEELGGLTSDSRPTEMEGVKIGTRVYNSSPSSGGYVGWVFIGTAWKGFGVIE